MKTYDAYLFVNVYQVGLTTCVHITQPEVKAVPNCIVSAKFIRRTVT